MKNFRNVRMLRVNDAKSIKVDGVYYTNIDLLSIRSKLSKLKVKNLIEEYYVKSIKIGRTTYYEKDLCFSILDNHQMNIKLNKLSRRNNEMVA
jgi:hypothetical protein